METSDLIDVRLAITELKVAIKLLEVSPGMSPFRQGWIKEALVIQEKAIAANKRLEQEYCQS